MIGLRTTTTAYADQASRHSMNDRTAACRVEPESLYPASAPIAGQDRGDAGGGSQGGWLSPPL